MSIFRSTCYLLLRCSRAEGGKGGERGQISGLFPPRPCQGLKNKYFKGSKGSKTMIQAANQMGSLHSAANTSAGRGGSEIKEQHYPSQTSSLKNAKARKWEAARSTAKLLPGPGRKLKTKETLESCPVVFSLHRDSFQQVRGQNLFPHSPTALKIEVCSKGELSLNYSFPTGIVRFLPIRLG